MKNIEQLIDRDKWPEARKLILGELKSKPKDHWLLSRLSLTYYEERNYRQAVKFSKKALKIAPDCPLVLWDYASDLDMLGKQREAISVWKKILKSTPYEGCWESKARTQMLMVDCLCRIGQSYADLKQRKVAIKYLRRYLKYRKKGFKSIYKTYDAKKQLKELSLG